MNIFSKAFKNPCVKNMVFILFPFLFLCFLIFFFLFKLLPPLFPGEKKKEVSKDIHNTDYISGPETYNGFVLNETPHKENKQVRIVHLCI